jgi:hypothetical protein
MCGWNLDGFLQPEWLPGSRNRRFGASQTKNWCWTATWVRVRVRVTLQLTASQSVCPGAENHRGSWPHIHSCFKVTVLSMWSTLSDERSGFVICQDREQVPSGLYTAHFSKIPFTIIVESSRPWNSHVPSCTYLFPSLIYSSSTLQSLTKKEKHIDFIHQNVPR